MKWINIKEESPEKQNNGYYPTVIVQMLDGEVAIGFIDISGDTWWVLHGDDDVLKEHDRTDVTHWMPLPEPPKEEN